MPPTIPAVPLPSAPGLVAAAPDRRAVLAWNLYDFGSHAFNTVMLSFVFSVYVTGTVAQDRAHGQVVWSNFQTCSGILLALLAPLMGAWADRVRYRRALLAASTAVVIGCMAACFLVRPHEAYLFLGAGLLSAAGVAQDIGGVFYNAMLSKLSTPATLGRISATAWALGYLGGVVCLVGALFGFILDGGMLGLPHTDAFNVRCVALFCALFFTVCAVPLLVLGPDGESRPGERFTITGAYREIASRVAHMWQRERGLLHFLVASAIFRDGLNSVFAFAGVIAASAYGFSQAEVIYFGLAASVSAAAGTWFFGRFDDHFGPRPVILASLTAICLFDLAIVVANTVAVFWAGGLLISSMVGPVQSASRTLLLRITPAGEENETFGLYATTGRVVSFLAPALIGLFTAALGVRWGIMGIVVTLLLGLMVFATLHIPGVTHDRARVGW